MATPALYIRMVAHSVDGKDFWQSSHESWIMQEREQRRGWIENAIAVAFPHGECTAEQMEALWRKFVCDLTDKELRPTAEWGDLFPEWITLVSGSREEIKELDTVDKSKNVSIDFREPAMDFSIYIPQDGRISLPDGLDCTRANEKIKKRLAFSRVNARCYNHRFFRSKAGHFGWGVEGMAAGDKICVVHGMSVPLLLRPEGHSFVIIGDGYLYGMMYGGGLEAGNDVVLRIV